MPLIYSFVARGTTVLADYTAYTGNFSTVAIQCLEKVPSNNSRFTFTCDRHTFNYSVDGGYSEYFRPCVRSRYCCTCLQTEAVIVSDQYHSHDETVIRRGMRRCGHHKTCGTCGFLQDDISGSLMCISFDALMLVPSLRSIPGSGGRGVWPADPLCVLGAHSGRVEGEAGRQGALRHRTQPGQDLRVGP